jgi:ferrous iron transport protein B
MHYKFALVGNPNCGKTTMFNEITGSTQYVGNWPGVTVEKKEGKARRFKEDIKIIDLPGIYSLSPYSMEEIIARDYILEERPDVLINIVDSTNIERNLYLTTQVIELGIPVIVALNMMDAVEARGDKIDIKAIERKLGVPIIGTSANKGSGINEVLQKALQIAESATAASVPAAITGMYDEGIEEYITQIEKNVVVHLGGKVKNSRWSALKLLEGDEKEQEKLNVADNLLKEIKICQEKLEKEYDNDAETVIADNRYRFITSIVSQTVKKKITGLNLTVSDKIDKIVTHRILAIPLFLVVMYGVFQITFGTIGSFTIDWVDVLVNETIAGAVGTGLEAIEVAPWLYELIVSGIIGGMGSMLVFVPQIMILFFFLALLEDSGYMARAAFIMDRLLRKVGLTGKSFIPMLMGLGCSAPAVMSTRTLENEKDRRLTIILTGFISCGAKLPVYALFVSAFFANYQAEVIFSIYILGMVVAILSGILLKKTLFKGAVAPFVMELPPYRIPTFKGLLIHMWDRGKGFIKKAGTVIFAAAVVIWFLQSFSFSLQMVENPANSIMGLLGKAIAPIFAPLGFGDWRSSVALLTGLVAKEVVVATMGILYGLGDVGEETAELATVLQSTFTPLTAYAFMSFSLLYVSCIAALGAIKREMNSWKWTLFTAGYQTGVAWLVAFIIYQGGRLLGFN